MSYVDKIIDSFGGVRAMAREIDRPPSTIASWRARGTIPDSVKVHVLACAQKSGRALRREDFFPDHPASDEAAA